MRERRDEVLLVFPGRFRAPDPQVPLQLLHVASALQRAGVRVRLFDMRLADYHRLALGTPLFVGLTCMSGPQIRYGLEFARWVRSVAPDVPLVWGGVHPTLLPEQTAASALVDVVVRGEAEKVVGPLAERLAGGEPLGDVPGLTYEQQGTIVSTPDAPLIDLDEIPVDLPWGLLHLDRYPTLQAGRVHLQTSRGCPSRCGFCYNTGFNKRRWRGKSPERVVAEIRQLLRRFPQTKIVDPVDDNLFVNRGRVEAVCDGLLAGGVRVAWRANCRFDYLAGYDDAFVALLERAGCTELDFGGESGSAAHAGVRLQGRERRRDRDLGREPAPGGALDRPLRLVAQRAARRDARRHGADLRPDGSDGPRQPAHAALRHLPLHAVPEPAAGSAAGRVQPAAVARGVGRDRGLPLRAALAQPRRTSTGCGRSRR